MEPKITLKGFVGNWDTHAIKDICEVNPKSTLPSEFEYVDLESVVGTEMISHRTEQRGSAPSRAQRLAKKGDIFYQTVRPYQKNNYLFDMDETNYVFSTGYAQLRTKINQGYLFTLMQSPSFVNKVLLECTGTSYPAINPTNLSKITIDIVDDENIQRIIASYFQHLDSLIQSTTKKIESLKQVKTASLQSMFPQEGETTPRVRFKGFSGEWEIDTLENIARIIKGEQINKNELFDHGTYYVLNGGVEPSGYTENYNTKSDTISISEGGNSCGYVYYNISNFWSGGHNYTLQNVSINNCFWNTSIRFTRGYFKQCSKRNI